MPEQLSFQARSSPRAAQGLPWVLCPSRGVVRIPKTPTEARWIPLVPTLLAAGAKVRQGQALPPRARAEPRGPQPGVQMPEAASSPGQPSCSASPTLLR